MKAFRLDAQMDLSLPCGPSVLSYFAGEAIRSEESRAYAAFLKRAKKDLELDSGRSTPFTYLASNGPMFESATLVSCVITRTIYLAGAHGVTVKTTYVFGRPQGKPVRVRIGDIVDDGHLPDVERKLFFMAFADRRTGWLQNGSKSGIDARELDRFWADDRGLHWEFDPCELGAYVEGSFTFSLSWRELEPWLKNTDWVRSISSPRPVPKQRGRQ